MAEKIKVKFNNNYIAKLRRIQNLPKEANEMFKAVLKRDALLTVKSFQDGIRGRAFGLKKLADGTIKRKKQMGDERPSTPLYGSGDSSKRNSYINMLRIRKVPNGYVVYPSKHKHWSGNITLDRLWAVHELGTMIKRGNSIIRIPPRPALLKAFRMSMMKRNVKADSKLLKRALMEFANTGKKEVFLTTANRFTKGMEKYEVRD